MKESFLGGGLLSWEAGIFLRNAFLKTNGGSESMGTIRHTLISEVLKLI